MHEIVLVAEPARQSCAFVWKQPFLSKHPVYTQVATAGSRPALSLDFVSDVLADGRRFRALALVVVDDFTREYLVLVVDASISGERVARQLDTLVAARRKPAMIVSDNGTELTSHASLRWEEERSLGGTTSRRTSRSRTPSSRASTPLRDECFHEHVFRGLPRARRIIEAWRLDYDARLPHAGRASVADGNSPKSNLYSPASLPNCQKPYRVAISVTVVCACVLSRNTFRNK
jgi:transposase InsO family protein